MNDRPPFAILHVEDNALDAELIAAELHRANLRNDSVRVDSREDFVAAIRNATFDIILADYQLPHFSGTEALALAREMTPETPFIFCSGMMGEEIAIESLRNGATDYVLKARLKRLAPAIIRALAEADERRSRKRAEEALEETEKRFRQMADSAPVMIWIAGPDGGWTYSNSLWQEFSRLAPEASLGMGWLDAIYIEDKSRVTEAYREALSSQTSFTIEFRTQRGPNDIGWVIFRGVLRTASGGECTGFIGSATEITDIKKTEERLRHSAKLESLGVLAGGIAHDFNNLLTGIMGNAGLLANEFPEDSREAEFAQSILQSGEAAAKLTKQMLAYSGKSPTHMRALNLSRSVREIFTLIETSIPHTAQVRLELAESLPAILADAAQLQQLVMNLVINAGEATAGKAGLVTIRTSLAELSDPLPLHDLPGSALTPGKYALLAVSDNGMGMDAQTKGKIFDPFFTTKFMGRGLGLAATSGIVRSHKGAMAIDTEPGVGTEFRVYFPLSSQQWEETLALRSVPRSGSGTILVVDDEPMVARTAAITLRNCGYRVIEAPDGNEALRIFASDPNGINLVLLDLTMPRMAGDECFGRMRQIRPDIAVLATSGYDEADALSRFKPKPNGFLQKPWYSNQLTAKVAEILTASIRG